MKILNNENIHLKVDHTQYKLTIKSKPSAKKANSIIEEFRLELAKIPTNAKTFNEILKTYSSIRNVVNACLEIKAINCSTFLSYKVKENAYSKLKSELRREEKDIHDKINKDKLTLKEIDYLSVFDKNSKSLNIRSNYFINNSNLSLKKIAKLYNESISEKLQSEILDQNIINKVHSQYTDSHKEAFKQLETAILIKNMAKDDLINWSTHKISRELNKINNNDYRIHSLISKFQEQLQNKGLKKKVKNKNNKKEEIENKYKNKKALEQSDFIYLFKNSNNISYLGLINSMNGDSIEELLFSKLKGVKEIIKKNSLRTALINNINKNKESYKKALSYSIENEYNFNSDFLNKFYNYTTKKEITTQNYFTDINSEKLSNDASKHLYNLLNDSED